MQEIEAKFYIQDLPQLQARLQMLEAAVIQERILETNLRFDLPDGSLSSGRRVLRLRRDSDARLTYKGASENHGGTLSRVEIELVVDDFDKSKLMLESLGYQVKFTYEKYRTTLALDAVHIMLDELPYGNFVEIEGGSAEMIRAAADRLHLQWDRAIATSYHALHKRLCAVRPHLDPAALTFRALQGVAVLPDDLSVQSADH